MDEAELEELARHMGHNLHEDVTELAKISKLLLVVEAGKAHNFAGKNIDEITFDGRYSVENP